MLEMSHCVFDHKPSLQQYKISFRVNGCNCNSVGKIKNPYTNEAAIYDGQP